MIIENTESGSIRCIRTRDLRTDEYTPKGNALPVYDAEREHKLLVHQERIQEELSCIR
ncbi:hypothetical protein LCGC14_2324220 [marine sediment metagenome]|uniref:Uncharacterized protein n=1 Tax=marine sediment metagenome TaxID=412755 RepID=A0A0F9CGW7_9ZZZZ